MVNTFIVHKKFKESAKCLDMRRLGKQRVECNQIIMLLDNDLNEVVNYLLTDLNEKKKYILKVFSFARGILKKIRNTSDIKVIKKLWNTKFKATENYSITDADIDEFKKMITLPEQITNNKDTDKDLNKENEEKEQQFIHFQQIVDNIAFIYKNLNFYLAYKQNSYFELPRTKDYIMISATAKYKIDGNIVIYNKKNYDRNYVFLSAEDERIIKLAWINHSCTRMWLGYIDCLKYYFNVHVDEWVRQKHVNNMEKYEVDSFVYPHWLDQEFMDNHKGALYFKDSEYYKNYSDYKFTDYLWPAKNISRLIGESVDNSEIEE